MQFFGSAVFNEAIGDAEYFDLKTNLQWLSKHRGKYEDDAKQ